MMIQHKSEYKKDLARIMMRIEKLIFRGTPSTFLIFAATDSSILCRQNGLNYGHELHPHFRMR